MAGSGMRPRRPGAMILAKLGAVVSAIGVPAAQRGYDYEDIVPEYCHTDMDWGPIPPRPQAATELLQAQVFVRHGARVLSSADFCWEGDVQQGTFTCDLSYLVNSVGGGSDRDLTPSFRTVYLPGRNALPGNCLVGQLVMEGFEMEKRNGERLREAYVERERLLPGTLENADKESIERTIFFRSTDVPRTKQSGMALFSGLYGDLGKLPYVKLNTMDMAKENMLVNARVCPAVQQTQDDYWASLVNKKELHELCDELSPSPIADTGDCFWFLQHQVDCLMSRMCPTVPHHPHNLTIPSRYTENGLALFKRIWREVDTAQHGMFHATSRTGIGPFVGEVLRAAEAAVKGAPVQKLLLYSGHDTGPMEPLWAAFDLRARRPYWPPFASMLVLELWNSTSGPLARWVSNGQVVAESPYSSFHEQARALVPSVEECRGKKKVFAVLDSLIPHLRGGREQPQQGFFLALALPALASSALTLLAVAACRSLRSRADMKRAADRLPASDEEAENLSKNS